MKKNIVPAIILSALLFTSCGLSHTRGQDPYIAGIQNATISSYEGTYSEAFENFFLFPEWHRIKDDKSKIDTIVFSGQYDYKEDKILNIKIKFLIERNTGTFKKDCLIINDKIQDNEIFNELVERAFKSLSSEKSLNADDLLVAAAEDKSQ